MKELLALTENLQTSRPIFKLSLERDKTYVRADVHEPYRPDVESGNILSQLICDHYEESFSLADGEFRVFKHNIVCSAMRQIRSELVKFIRLNLKMKCPKQSKLYRWFCYESPKTDEFNDILIMLYKHIHSFAGPDVTIDANDKQLQISNTLALMQAIMEKFK